MLKSRLFPALAVAFLLQLQLGCGEDSKTKPDATPVGNLPDQSPKTKEGKAGGVTRPGPPAPPPIAPLDG